MIKFDYLKLKFLQNFDQLQGIGKENQAFEDNLDIIDEVYSPNQLKMDQPLTKGELVQIVEEIRPLNCYCKIDIANTIEES